MLGAEHDKADSVRETVTFALRHHIDTVMMNILTPLPGMMLSALSSGRGAMLLFVAAFVATRDRPAN